MPDYDSHSDAERLMDIFTDKFFLFIALFTFINLLAVNAMWLKRRKSEMAIKKTFGYNDMQIIAENMKEYVLALLLGMLICAVTFGIYVGVYHDKIRMVFVEDTVLKTFIAILLMLFFNFTFSYKYVSTTNLANGIKER